MSSVAKHSWHQSMKDAIRDSTTLLHRLRIDPDALGTSAQGERQFPVFVPEEYLNRMHPEDPNDPLLLQVLARKQESDTVLGFDEDPVGDSRVEKVPGLLQKYHGRVLLIVTGACAIHCRYCFRRHYPYSSAPKSIQQWEPALQYIASDTSIQEVIYSGGDPLTVADSVLADLTRQISSIPHIRRLRIHTRMPAVIPCRVDSQLCAWLKSTPLSKWVVLHINHPHEIDYSVETAIEKLQATGTVVLNQTVLLKGINDKLDVLRELCERLVQRGVMPYYLHQLDRVAGASHFECDPEAGRSLVERLSEMLPGYAVPKYVAEIEGRRSKTPLR